MGPRVGMNISRVEINSAPNNTAPEDLKQTHHWGYHAGVFTRFNLLLCHVQPEILFTTFDAQFKRNNKVLKLSCTKLDIPAMVGLSFLRVFRIQLGPVFSWLLSTKEEKEYVRKHYSSMTTGWQAGLGVDIWRIVIDFKYASRTSKFEDKITGISTDYGYTPWILSVGFNIL
jgi:Outer membrane protein beta-barrel domain